MNRQNIAGVFINNMTYDEIWANIESFLNSPRQHIIVTSNPEFIVLAQKDEEFRNILNTADLSLPDGIGLVLAGKFLGLHVSKRMTGNDLVKLISSIAEQKKCSIFLLGGDKDVAKKAAVNLQKAFPLLKIAGTWDGEMIDNIRDNHELVDRVQKSGAQILFVALGHGKQEKCIYYHLSKLLNIKLAIGVGGVFDYLSGNKKRAPLWMRKSGLEWLYRLLHEPRRLKRIYNAIIVFPIIIIRQKVSHYL